MWWCKKKITVENYVSGLLEEKLPKAIQFFVRENERSHQPISINEKKLNEIGAGMILFFLGKFYPDTNKKNKEIMSRAYKQVERQLSEASPKEAFAWWKAFIDGAVFQENQPRLKIACRLVWEKLIPDKTFREASPLKTFGYFLEMEVQGVEKINLG